jgi:molybdopterin/thiamine biosynthesis adenylyltransferase
MDQFGLPKVLALYQRLLGFNPEIAGHIDAVYVAVGGTNRVEDEQKLLATIASADLVIDTTGSHAVSRFINELSYELGIPALYASVTNGAWGGEIVRVLPPETACWMCWFSQYEFSRPPSEPEPGLGIFAPGCNQPTFTGTSYETGIVANMSAWMAAETLLRGEPGHKDFGGDYLRWEARSQNGSPLPDVKVLSFERRPNSPVCSGT